MKKVLFSIIALFCFTLSVFADGKKDAVDFFNKYVNAANTYDQNLPSFYLPSAKIIRQVVKPDGSTVDVYGDTAIYFKQMKIGQAGAKLRKYKNTYTNISVADLGNGKYKVSSLRQPSGETYWLKTYMIVQQQANGQWKIIEEMMQTKEQIFLKYAK